MSMATRRQALYQSITTCVRDCLTHEGVPVGASQGAASAVVELLASQWGGQVISFPRAQRQAVRQRWQRIAEQFDGNNYSQLAAAHGCTERHIRKVIKRMKPAGKGDNT